MIMMIIMNVLILIFSITYIWDYSGFIYDLTKTIYKLINPNKEYMGQPLFKPLGCSQCMVFWVVLGYTIFIVGLPIISSLGISVLSSYSVKIISKLIEVVNEKINLID